MSPCRFGFGLFLCAARVAMRGLLTTIGIIFLANASLGFTMPVLNMDGGWALLRVAAAAALDTGALFEALQNSSMVRCDAPAFTYSGIGRL